MMNREEQDRVHIEALEQQVKTQASRITPMRRS